MGIYNCEIELEYCTWVVFMNEAFVVRGCRVCLLSCVIAQRESQSEGLYATTKIKTKASRLLGSDMKENDSTHRPRVKYLSLEEHITTITYASSECSVLRDSKCTRRVSCTHMSSHSIHPAIFKKVTLALRYTLAQY
jgi:hypothetical protein